MPCLAVLVIGSAGACLAQTPPPAAPAPFGATCLTVARTHLVKEGDLARLDQRRSQTTLDASRALLDKAQSANNAAAVVAAQRAVNTAAEALRKNRMREERALKALAWLDRLRAGEPSARPVAGFMPRVDGTVDVTPAGGGPARRILGDVPPVLSPGDTVRTGRDGRVDLILPEGDLLSLDAGSAATLVEEGLEAVMGVVKARVTRRLVKKFEVRSPSFVLAVRGTEFIVREVPGKPSSTVVLEGTVAFSDRAGKKTVLVGAGEQSYLLPEGTPAEPVEANVSEMPRWWDE